MPSVWMNSFEWDGLSEILARPAAELAERLRRKQGPCFKSRSSLPQDEVELGDSSPNTTRQRQSRRAGRGFGVRELARLLAEDDRAPAGALTHQIQP